MAGSASARAQKWEDLNVTKDEVDRIGKALKDENFRKLFAEYAEEISDPKNREIYEREIAQMEGDRGMDVQFIHPQPGMCLPRTSRILDMHARPGPLHHPLDKHFSLHPFS